MNIVILSGWKIFPNQSGGHLRTGSIAKGLARLGHQVTIWSVAGRRDDYGGNHGDYLTNKIEENLTEELNLSKSVGALQSLARRIKFPKLWLYVLFKLGFCPKHLRSTLDAAQMVICDHPYIPSLRASFPKIKWILLSHNHEFRLLENGSAFDRALAPWLLEIERKAPKSYDGILACADEDAKFFADHSDMKQNIVVIPNGIDSRLYKPDANLRAHFRNDLGVKESDHVIIFTGSRYKPNLDAFSDLEKFVQDNMLFLVEHNVIFLVVGSVGGSPQRHHRIIVTGPVPEVVPYFSASDFAINPVRTGSGSNVKIFEYIAATLPVISTAFGVRGTALESKVDYFNYDSDDELKSAISQSIQKGRDNLRQQALETWDRHKSQFDMTEILRRDWENGLFSRVSPGHKKS